MLVLARRLRAVVSDRGLYRHQTMDFPMITQQEINELRTLLLAATAGEWHPGHFSDPQHSCQCRHVLSEGHMGAIATIGISDGLPVSEGGNDAPCAAEAMANLLLITRMKNLLPELLDAVEGR